MARARPAQDPELFRSADLLARAVGRGRGDVCVVTFACLLDTPDLAAPGFGEDFFLSRGIDAVHVTCAGNAWYQYEDLYAALDAVRAAVRPYRRVLAYGSSMGGYAAVRYGGRAGAHEALAISPQFSIDRQRVPFETRWRPHAGAIRFLHENDAPAIGRATVVYDPLSLDAPHAELIAAAVPARLVGLRHAGHPAGAYLAEAGLLPELVTAACAGDVPADLERRARAARRRSGQYLFNLARRSPRRRRALKLALARRAVEAAPSDPVYRSYLGLMLEWSGDDAGAEASHRVAAESAPDTPWILGRLARFLLRRGRAREGVALAETVYRLAPEMHATRHLACAALLVEGRIRSAIGVVPGLRPMPHLLGDAWRALAWRPREPGWQLRGFPLRAGRLPFHLGTADEIRAADIAHRRPVTPEARSRAIGTVRPGGSGAG